MSSRSTANRPRRPHTSDNRAGGGVSGERKRAHCLGLKKIWGYLAGCFTRAQSRRSGKASQGGSRRSSPPAMTPNPSEPGSQCREPHHGTQEQRRPDMPAIPRVESTGYRPPPELGQEVCTMPQEASPGTEVIIALMGVTGAGKSYFIREVSGNSEVVVSGDLHSCTREVQSYSFEFEGVKVTLVDTPGFNDTNRSDTEVLRAIADWTSTTYREKRLLSGIIYLHPITQARMGGSALKNLRMFQSLCGQKFLKNVFLTTTQWSNADPEEGGVRENSLRNGDFWGGLIEKGATMQRFHGTRESGLELIRKLMPNERKPLDIQIQIVNQHMTLLETGAGKCINEELIALEKKKKEEIESLERELQEAIKARDNEVGEIIMAEQAKVRENLEKAAAEKRLLAELHAAGAGMKAGEREVRKKVEKSRRLSSGDARRSTGNTRQLHAQRG
ncbi:P-loop containing nucleoside triphosphate hydrolase protein [Tuber brumale]|nr:P-loop containing nucleoside triphosphate hydrolase protein [Tuber brumale]